MPIVEGKYQCLICEDEFEATSGSFAKCSCGKSEVEPSTFGYSYRQGNRVKTIEQHTFYYEEEFAKLPEEAQKIYDEIKEIKNRNKTYNFYLYEMFDTGKQGEKYLSQINLEYYEWISSHVSGQNYLKLTIRLGKEDYKGDQRTIERLKQFYDFVKQIESGELDFKNRGTLMDIVDRDNIDFREEPTGDTNYFLYL